MDVERVGWAEHQLFPDTALIHYPKFNTVTGSRA